MLTRPLVCPTLVGRDDELHELVEARFAASRRRGSLVVVSGDAGIGKSRLLESFRRTFSNGRATLGVGYCRDFGNAPYGAILQSFKSIGAAGPPAASTRNEQLAQLMERLTHACAHRTLVLFVEDVHWADEGTLTFLQHVLPSISALRLLIVVTYRSDAVDRLPDLEPWLARLTRDRGTRHIHLHPLTTEAMRELIRLAAGSARQLASTEIEEIIERSDGNPLFAEELLQHTLDMQPDGETRVLPLTIRAAVQERVLRLSERERAVLTHASILGRRFSTHFLAELCGLKMQQLLPILQCLRDLQLICEVQGETDLFAFRHALTREAIYSELLGEQARGMHARILRALEAQEQSSVQDLGYHAWAAGDAEKAMHYNEAAGDRADLLHAYRDAVNCYERALSFTTDETTTVRLLMKEVCVLRSHRQHAAID